MEEQDIKEYIMTKAIGPYSPGDRVWLIKEEAYFIERAGYIKPAKGKYVTKVMKPEGDS